MTDRELLEKIAIQVGALTNQVNGLQVGQENFATQIGTLTDQVNGLEESFTTKIGTLTNRTDTLTTQVGTLTNRTDTLTAQIGTLTDRTDTLTAQIGTLTDRTDTLTAQTGTLANQVDGLQAEMQEGFKEAYIERQEMKTEIRDIKNTVINVENEQKQKFSALFDGYKQNSEILERIEKEVSKHEEIILRRIQ